MGISRWPWQAEIHPGVPINSSPCRQGWGKFRGPIYTCSGVMSVASGQMTNAIMHEWPSKHCWPRIPVAPSHIHPIRCAGDPGAEATRYDQLLRTRLLETTAVLDLVFLGLGQDGHTASLFPYSSVLEEKQRWVAEVLVAEPKISRVTLTPVVINAARTVIFLVFGGDKAQILKSVLEGPFDTRRLPAQGIQPTSGRLVWLVDREAASLLETGRWAP